MNKNTRADGTLSPENKSLRLFIAILLEPSLQSGLTGALEKLSILDVPVKWLEPGNLHLTLYFLGDVSEQKAGSLTGLLEEAKKSVAPFEMQLGGLGAFPNTKKPRVLFAPVTLGFESLRTLASDIAVKLRGFGEKQEDRDFNAHVTLGRVKGFKGAKTIFTKLNGEVPELIGKMQVKSFTLVQSELRPSGPIYTTLKEFRLEGK